jgi:SAM-dependent methyltransferase
MNENPRPSPYPAGFVYGRGEADPRAWSLSGLKLKRCLAALRPVRGAVLELGCGAGQYLRALRTRRPDLDVHGVDLDSAAVKEAQTVPGADCRQADAAQLPYPEGRFAAVVGFDILEHVARPERVLAEAARVLSPGGLLHLYVPCEGNPGTVYVRRGHGLKARWGGHVQQFTTERLLELVQAAGFTLLEIRHADYGLTQRLDYAFFRRLDASPHPERLWAGQSLSPGNGLYGLALRQARRILSAVSWLEGTLRRGRGNALGAHVTAVKK